MTLIAIDRVVQRVYLPLLFSLFYLIGISDAYEMEMDKGESGGKSREQTDKRYNAGRAPYLAGLTGIFSHSQSLAQIFIPFPFVSCLCNLWPGSYSKPPTSVCYFNRERYSLSSLSLSLIPYLFIPSLQFCTI